MLLNSTEGACDFGDHCKYNSESSGTGKRVQPRGSCLNPIPRTNNKFQPDFTDKCSYNKSFMGLDGWDTEHYSAVHRCNLGVG